jgi:hypothetical protein
MLEIILVLTVVNTLLQVVAVVQRHATLRVARENGKDHQCSE